MNEDMPNVKAHEERAMRMVAREAASTGSFHRVMLLHDDWCDFLNKKGDCSCDPDYVRVPKERGRR